MMKYNVGDRLFVDTLEEGGWTGDWHEIPVKVIEVLTTRYRVKLLKEVPKWGRPTAHIAPQYLHSLPLEEAVREKLGDDYL